MSTGQRRDWRDVLRDGSDLALLGIVATLAAVPLVTAPAAVATASAALHDWLTDGSWPTARRTLRRFVRAVPAGIPVALLTLAAAGLLALDLAALARGAVPGGPPALLLTVVVTVALAGYAGLVVVAVGRTGGRGWRAAARTAAAESLARPARWAGVSGVCAVAALLALLVTPVAVPILAGYVLAACHAVARRPVRAEVTLEQP
ncbi:hypothetical protein V6U90_09470 [Micromonospora sp. CPCC 206060]|uniref:hypothetical protein n=1 Tax=Micromonospora sp. CPCC 206060 TaxID=3122406 RepID=UPI002FEEAF46